MGVFEHFPYVNYHELNFSWILRKIKELEDVIGSQIVDLVARAGVAENAQAISDLTETVETNAETAHNEAAAAAQAAATADTKATNAASAAATADTKATNAASAANTAQTTANAAQTSANNALSRFKHLATIQGTTVKDAMSHAFDAIDVYDKAVSGEFTYSGLWMYTALKYSNGAYGMMLAVNYYPTEQTIILFNRLNGVDTARVVSLGASL